MTADLSLYHRVKNIFIKNSTGYNKVGNKHNYDNMKQEKGKETFFNRIYV